MSAAMNGSERGVSKWRDTLWQLYFWDPVRWQPRVVARRGRQWLMATRRRRWTTWACLVVCVVVVFPVMAGAVAAAQSDSATDVGGGNSALGWTHARDPYGVLLSNYVFATNHGSIFHPVDGGKAFFIGLLFAIFIVLVTIPVWLVGWVFSFGWMNVFAVPLNGVAHALSGQIATPIMFIAFGSVGAFFVGYFIVRGFHSKAAIQVVTMVIVAFIGPMYLADPLGEVLSPDGLLAEGRNVGLSVSAGLNGDSNPNPGTLVTTLQEDMADNFARKPLQVWNFGHVIDDEPACRAAWNSAMSAGSESRAKNGMKACGDSAAYASANNPSLGQIGAGIVLLLTATILLFFAAYMAIRIIWSALDSVYWGFMTIFSFAGGGLVYGPTQTFMVRSVVHGVISAARMCVEIIVLSIYLLILGDLFRQAKGQNMAIFVMGAIFMIIAIAQFRRLGKSLHSGNEWVANRVALAIQGSAGSGGGSGGSGANALGMGQMGANHSMAAGLGLMALMGGTSTIANSPITEWMMGGLPGSIRPQSLMKKRITRAQGGVWMLPGFGGRRGVYAQSYMNRMQFSRAAEEGAREFGGLTNVKGVSAAVQNVFDHGGDMESMWGALYGAGLKGRHELMADRVLNSWGVVRKHALDRTVDDAYLGHTVASMSRLQAEARRFAEGKGNAEEVAADFATLQASAFRLRRSAPGKVTLSQNEKDWAQQYIDAPDKAKMEALLRVADNQPITGTTGADAEMMMLQNAGIDATAAGRIRTWVRNEHAERIYNTVDALWKDPTDYGLMRDVRQELYNFQLTDHFASGNALTASKALHPVGQNSVAPSGWTSRMQEVKRHLR